MDKFLELKIDGGKIFANKDSRLSVKSSPQGEPAQICDIASWLAISHIVIGWCVASF